MVNQFANTTTRTASQDDPESYSDYYDSDSSDDSQTTTTGMHKKLCYKITGTSLHAQSIYLVFIWYLVRVIVISNVCNK